jgi:secreted PhoX family phosphatase
MDVTRRSFLTGTAAAAAGFAGLHALLSSPGVEVSSKYGPLHRDPSGLLTLPEGFRCTAFSRTGETMDDGLLVPGGHDGMAAFPGPDGLTILVRNHELVAQDKRLGAFGPKNERLGKIPADRFFDYGKGVLPGLGGTSTIVFDTKTQKPLRHFLSLAGTWRNCAGGPTPWGSWVTCEESLQTPKGPIARSHGWCFEVPAEADPRLADPVALKDMGRFNHEAVAVDPKSGTVYLTEDRADGLLYRFTPKVPGKLDRGGRLQALMLKAHPKADTGNKGRGPELAVGKPLDVEWIDLKDVANEKSDDLRARGNRAGAAKFWRGEGIWTAKDGLYFCATSGGSNSKGQVWKLALDGSSVTLFLEPRNADLVDMCDNLCVAPWGDLILCEDGPGHNRLVGVTPKGEVYTLAQNVLNLYELCGACFSPDGSTLFVNLQRPGITVAITGPWNKV